MRIINFRRLFHIGANDIGWVMMRKKEVGRFGKKNLKESGEEYKGEAK